MGILTSANSLEIQAREQDKINKEQEKRNQSFEHRIQTINADRSKFNNHVIDFIQQFEALETNMNEFWSEFNANMGEVNRQITALHERIDDNDDDLVDIKSAIDKLEVKVDSQSKDATVITERTNSNTKQIENLHSDYSNIANSQTELSDNLKGIKTKIEQFDRDIPLLFTKTNDMQDEQQGIFDDINAIDTATSDFEHTDLVILDRLDDLENNAVQPPEHEPYPIPDIRDTVAKTSFGKPVPTVRINGPIQEPDTNLRALVMSALWESDSIFEMVVYYWRQLLTWGSEEQKHQAVKEWNVTVHAHAIMQKEPLVEMVEVDLIDYL